MWQNLTLKNLPLGAKLVGATLLPVLVCLALALQIIMQAHAQQQELNQVTKLLGLVPALSDAVHELQRERGTSAGYLSSDDMQEFQARLTERRQATDLVVNRLDATIARFDRALLGPAELSRLTQIETGLQQLPQWRNRVSARSVEVEAMARDYTALISDMHGITSLTLRHSSDAEITSSIAAFSALMAAKEYAGLERAMGAAGFAQGEFDQTVYTRMITLQGERKAELVAFEKYANPEQRAFYNMTVAGGPLREIDRMRDLASANPFGGDVSTVDPGYWFDQITIKIDLMKLVEDRLAEDFMQLARQNLAVAEKTFWSTLILALSVSLAVALISLSIIRALRQRLAALSEGMQRMAAGDYETPIDQSSSSDQLGQMTQMACALRKSLRQAHIQAEQQNTQLRTERDRAEQAGEAKIRFMANMSHELRTPLNAILGYTQLINSDHGKRLDRDQINEFSGLIHDSGKHLLAMINDLLDLVRIQDNRVSLAPVPQPVEDLVRKALNAVAPIAADHRITLADDLPEPLSQVLVDPTAGHQVLLNLLTNAIKYSGSDTTVTLSAAQHQQQIRITVADQGTGIPQDVLDRIGTPLDAREDHYETSSFSAGLGLSITKLLLDRMNGTLKFETVKPHGTRAIICLPQADAAENASADSDEQAKALTKCAS